MAKKIIALLLCLLACAACGAPNENGAQEYGALQPLGQGAASFVFRVETKDEKTQYQIRTDAATVGEALLALGLIAGDTGGMGLMVHTVCGVPLDYEKDGAYWAFYVNGVYAMAGVDQTPVEPGTVYEFKYTEA